MMVETIKPHGAVNEKIVKGIGTFRGEFVIIDDQHNILAVPEYEYLNLKGKVEDYGEIRTIKNISC